MRILLTGGAGFIGSRVGDFLREAGHTLAVVDNLSSGHKDFLPQGAHLYPVDIRSREALREVFEEEKPEIVNHHAAQASVQNSIQNPLEDLEVNLFGSLHLLELSLECGVKRVVYISTGGALYGEPLYHPCDEAHPVHPLSPYGTSKHTVEHYLYLYHRHSGLDYRVLRYPNVYGPRQDPLGEAGVVAIFTRRMLRGEEVVIYGDGHQERDFVYVDDIAQANLLALKDLSSGGPSVSPAPRDPLDCVFNLGSGKGTSVNEIFGRLQEFIGYKDPPRYAPQRPGEVYRISLKAEKAQRDLGWRPEIDLREGLRRTVEWFKEKNRTFQPTR